MSIRSRTVVCVTLAGTLVLLAGCAGKGAAPETRKRVSIDVDTWTGRHRDQVLTALGKPNSTEPDGRGGSILNYAELKRKVSLTVTQRGQSSPSPADDLSGDPIHDETFRSPTHERKQSAKFWVDEDGMVYRFWFAPDLYKKGEVPYPPARSETPSEPDS